MAIALIFNDLSSVMTVVSLTTFVGILWWAFVLNRSADFDEAAHLPFADDADGGPRNTTENKHG
ncbi:MAG: cytochrome c oxidase cbb3-type subunit 4 [Bradyrhizobium sp.]|jgi:cytochrome c oxidase cbb3-type subunit 4